MPGYASQLSCTGAGRNAKTSGRPHPPAAQIEQQVDALVADMLRGCQMPQRSDIVHARCLRQARANVAAIVRAGCKQLHLQVRLASPQRFEQGHRQQARRVGAKAVGHESELQRAAAAQRGRWQWCTEEAIACARVRAHASCSAALASSLRNAKGSTAASPCVTAVRTCAARSPARANRTGGVAS